MILSQICEIQLGYTARGRLDPVDTGGVRAVQLRDTAPEGGRNTDVTGQYRLDAVPERYWAKQGDLLFRSRGDRNTATALSDWLDATAVVVMPLVILRPESGKADPQYLAWFINQATTQRYFDACARGTGMRMIPIGCLANLEVPLPDIVAQKLIAEIDELARQEFALTKRLAEKRRQVTTFALLERAQQNSQRVTEGRAAPPSRSKKEGRK
jgi:hypothetical protein